MQTMYAPVYQVAQPAYAGGYSSGGFGYGGSHQYGYASGSSTLLAGTAGFLGGMAVGHAIGDSGDSGYGDAGYNDGVSGGDF